MSTAPPAGFAIFGAEASESGQPMGTLLDRQRPRNTSLVYLWPPGHLKDGPGYYEKTKAASK